MREIENERPFASLISSQKLNNPKDAPTNTTQLTSEIKQY